MHLIEKNDSLIDDLLQHDDVTIDGNDLDPDFLESILGTNQDYIQIRTPEIIDELLSLDE